jgi:hypothetical protein
VQEAARGVRFCARTLRSDVSVAVGVAGAIAMGLDSDATNRASNVTFGVVAGIVAALLVYGGWFAGRAGMRAIRSA